MSQANPPYGSVPYPTDAQTTRGYGAQSASGVSDFAHGNPYVSSPPSPAPPQPSVGQQQPPPAGAFREDFNASLRSSSATGDGPPGLQRSASTASTTVPSSAPSRNNTLKKRSSVRRSGSTRSIKRSGSRRSLKAGSLPGFGSPAAGDDDDFNSWSYTPVPTQGSPTEVLANRFQAWRQLLKSLIAYFRDVQSSYDARAKAIHKVQNTIASIQHPSVFLSEQGLGDATRILDSYHKRSINEAAKSRDIETDVISALSGLRSDLGQKIKEIKSLSGDFKNSVEKEKEGTRREVDKLQEALQHADHEDGGAVGKNDPFVVRLGVDRMIERQIDEENYVHRAYLNLESSGRELESIVVGEIQKAYNALAGILRREADDAYHVVEGLRAGPIAMPKDQEWLQFVAHDPRFVDPSVPLRRIEDIEYPGKHHPAAVEVRAGMLERKSKYLKSYTPGWYVLSPTHLHEFKSADKIYTQPPVMSLYLPDQKLGSKSEAGSSSHKFILKGRQSGSMHKGHNWVFRAESHDTMLAWYEDIRALTETTSEQRNAFVRKHARSLSGTSDRGTVSSDGMEDDEADAEPYSADAASLAEQNPLPQERAQRPQPGGRFPSDLQVPRFDPLSPSSGSSEPEPDRDVVAAAAALPGSAQHEFRRPPQADPYRLDGVPSGTRPTSGYTQQTSGADEYALTPVSTAPGPAPSSSQRPPQTISTEPTPTQTYSLPLQHPQPVNQHQVPTNQEALLSAEEPRPSQQPPPPPAQQPVWADEPAGPAPPGSRPHSAYGEWMAPAAAAGAAGVGAGVLGADASAPHHDGTSTAETAPQAPTPVPAATAATAPSHASGAASAAPQPRTVSTTSGSPGTDAADAAATTTTTTTTTTSGLGGLEATGARETGRFPTVVRHDTGLSASALHVPGEYPKRGSHEGTGIVE